MTSDVGCVGTLVWIQGCYVARQGAANHTDARWCESGAAVAVADADAQRNDGPRSSVAGDWPGSRRKCPPSNTSNVFFERPILKMR